MSVESQVLTSCSVDPATLPPEQANRPVRGCFFYEVSFENRSTPLLFYVVEQGTSLVGLEGIKALKLRIEGSQLQCFQTSAVPNAEAAVTCPFEPSRQLPPALQQKFGLLFTNELGVRQVRVLSW